MRAKSKELKELQGTFEPSKEGAEGVQWGAYDRIPQAPDYFPLKIQKMWIDRCKDMKKTGYLARAFMPLLESYCMYYMFRDDAIKHLLDEGLVVTEHGEHGSYDVESKWWKILNDTTKKINEVGAKLGFSPLDMQKIPAIQPKQEAEMSLLK